MRPRVATILGLAVAVLYLVGAALSAHLDPLDGKPLLDGLSPPPAYQWVTPPSALASTNQTPDSKRVTLSSEDATYDPKSGSAPGVYATANYQTTLSLARHAIGPRPGATQVELVIAPSAPDPGAVLPDGYGIAGNVITISGTYRPTGGKVTALDGDAQLLLAYPAIFGGIDDTVLTSSDGITWTALQSTNHLGQQLVVANIDHFGIFAVGQTSGSGGVSTTGATESVPIWVIAVLVVLAVLAGLTAIAVRRASAGPSAGRQRGPDRDDDVDPWKG